LSLDREKLDDDQLKGTIKKSVLL